MRSHHNDVMLQPGDAVNLADRGPATIDALLGQGGQGAVYRAFTANGQHLAVKWYFSDSATAEQRASLELLIERGAPSPRFLWPLDLVERNGDSSFGYAMDIRPPAYKGLADLLAGRVEVNLTTLSTMGRELAEAYLMLHNQGLCYRDVSYGNVFFDPDTGRVLICDNDNVGVNGASTSRVLGTRRFMAPEIVRREALPSIATDHYSLSVLLFMTFMVGHPLIGRREREFHGWDAVTAETVLFGTDPLFIYDPADGRNAPDPELHAAVIANWDLYPEYVQALFTQAFTTGLHDATEGRVRDGVWRLAFARLHDLVRVCPLCGKQNFFDPARAKAKCWSCAGELLPPLRLRFERSLLVLADDTRVHRHHLQLDYDYTNPIGRVVQHPERPGVWGLANTGQGAWVVSLPDGRGRIVEPGQTIGLIRGMRVDFGGKTATLDE